MGIIINDCPDTHGTEIAGVNFLDNGIPRIPGSYNHHGYAIIFIVAFPPFLPRKPIGKPAHHRSRHKQECIEKIIALGHIPVKQ